MQLLQWPNLSLCMQAVQSLVSSGALASGLTAAGLPVASASFLQSQEAGSETLLGQAQALLAANSTSGGPTGTTAAARKYGLEHAAAESRSMQLAQVNRCSCDAGISWLQFSLLGSRCKDGRGGLTGTAQLC